MVISTSLTDAQLLSAIHESATAYNRLLDKTFLIVGKNTKVGFLWFHCRFEKNNFMHLLGLNSHTISPDTFFDRALNNSLLLSDCNASRHHQRSVICAKCSCCAEMLTLANARYMTIGNKDKISLHVDFTYAYGNEATLGFLNVGSICYPLTLIPENIEQATMRKYRILLIASRSIHSPYFDTTEMEIKAGIFSELFASFPPELQSLLKK